MEAALTAYATFDKGDLTPEQIRAAKRDLTVRPKDYLSGGDLAPIHAYVESDTTLSVGPDYAAVSLGADLIPNTTDGLVTSFLAAPEPRNPDQVAFFSGIVEEGEKGLPFLARADTGFGKTVSAAYLIYHIGRKAAVILPNTTLARQWKKELVKLGLCTSDDVGIVSGWGPRPEEHWRDKKVVLCVVNSLACTSVPEGFPFHEFGTVIWDEVHRMGAREFCKTLQLFSATVRMGLSATPKRKDGQDMLYLAYFGEEAVVAECPPMPCHIYTLEYSNPSTQRVSKYKKPPQLLNILAKDRARNNLLVERIGAAWERGRVCFGVGDRIEQIGVLRAMLGEWGIPLENIGIIAGEIYDPEDNTRRKLKDADEQRVKEDPRFEVVLATYGKAKEGLDIPRLDYGIDLTPRADGVQMIGRIRRLMDGKPEPIWETIFDRGVVPFDGYYKSRIRDIRTSKGVSIK